MAVPVNMTPIRIASGPAERLDNRIRVRVGKPFIRSVDPQSLSERIDECAEQVLSADRQDETAPERRLQRGD